MLRTTVSGNGGFCTRSAKVSVQLTPRERSSLSSDGICGRLRRKRTAWPFSSAIRLTSDISEPALARTGSTSIASAVSNTIQTVSARRNSAAGVAPGNENVTRKPSLSRWASTAGLPPARASAAGGDGAAAASGASIAGAAATAGTGRGASVTGAVFCSAAEPAPPSCGGVGAAAFSALAAGAAAIFGSSGSDGSDRGCSVLAGAAAGCSLVACSGLSGSERGGSDLADSDLAGSDFAVSDLDCSGLISILACWAMLSDVTGAIAAAPFGLARGVGNNELSEGFAACCSFCWKATSTM
ncbi:hypothetical protein ACVIWU_002719 [Bradyrhizobium sp. USDA 4509]